MKSRVIPFVVLVALLAVFLGANIAQARLYPDGKQPKPFIIKGVVSVQFEDDVDLSGLRTGFGRASFNLPSFDRVLDRFKVNDARKLFPWRTEKPPVNSGLKDLTRFYEISIPENQDVMEVVKELNQNPHVRVAEPVWALPLLATPNDPLWPSQWAMEPPGPDPDFYHAWDIESGSDSIKLAMIDSGVKYIHRDLKGNIWVNPGEDLDGDGVVFDPDDLNNIDDDGNGVKDDLIGYDFFTGFSGGTWPGEDGGVPDPDPDDFSGHGTHCAGIAAAMTNNGFDVTGAAGGWFGGNRAFRGASIMCLRVGGTADDGLGYVNSSDCGTAIDYAAANGANVISCSWGSSSGSAMIAGMQNAAANGVTICHAAGNDGFDNPDYLDWDPYTNVLSVASVASNDVKASSSNYGEWIDVSAPGVGILSTYSNMGVATTATLGGTSMASPMVAGLALLIRSAMPSLTKDQVDSLIINTADNIDAQNPLYIGMLGSGRINAFTALSALASARFTADVTEGDAPLQVQFTDLSPASPDLPSSWDWTFGTGDVSTDQNPLYTYTDPGMYSVSLITDVNNPLGLGEEHLKNYIWVRADSMLLDSVDCEAGDKVVIPIYLANTAQVSVINFPFRYTNSEGVTLDSFSVVGLRTEYFDDVKFTSLDPNNHKYTIKMISSALGYSQYLTPGNGPILNLYFNVPLTAVAAIIDIDTVTIGSKVPYVGTLWGNIVPHFEAGKIVITQCAHGDCDCSGTIDISDLTALVDYLFAGGSVDSNGGDVNGSGGINISDITYLADYFFGGGPPPPTN